MSSVTNDSSIPLQNECYIQKLPNEIIAIFYKMLDLCSCAQFNLTCKKFYKIQNEDKSLWKFIVYRDFSYKFIEKKFPIKDWKKFYCDHIYLKSSSNEPFPFSSTNFIVDPRFDWKVKYTNSKVVRKYYFYIANANQTNNSETYFSNFELSGLLDGRLQLFITVKGKIALVESYFNKIGSYYHIYSSLENYNIIEFNDKNDIKKAFFILKEYNTIPKEHLDLIEKIILTGDWTKVTPLKDYEEKAFKTREVSYLANQRKNYFYSLFQFFFCYPKNTH